MPSTITKTMPEILIDRMNATRQERQGFMESARKCAYMEQSMEKMLGNYGFSVVETAEGYAAIRRKA